MISRNTIIRSVELLVNISIIVVACLLATVLVRNYLLAKPSYVTETNERSEVQAKLSIPGVEFSSTRRTLILALSTTCHFCSESAPFYKQLAKNAKNMRVIAVIPQELSEGRDYLKGLSVTVDEVRQVSLDTIGVNGTPTLMLLDSSGVVTKRWVGKLTAEGQRDVMDALAE